MNYTNELNLPKPLVDAATSSYKYKKNRYSVTALLGGACEAILKRRHDSEITEDVSQRIWAVFGTAVHKVLQEAEATETQLQENWISIPITVKKNGNCDKEGNPIEPYEKVGNYELSGIFDLYDDSTGTVTDYKTCATWKIIFGDFEDWRKQTLAYCWMLRSQGFDARRGEIVALIRDHNQRKANTEKDYPKHPVFKIEWDFKESDFEQMQLDVISWFSQIMDEEELPDSELEPCSPEQRWHRDDKWAVMRKGQKRAVKLFDTKEDALGFMDWLANQASNKGKPLYIEERRGEDTKCESYCSVAEFCPYYRALMKDREQQD